jgi:WD40 repeat protein
LKIWDHDGALVYSCSDDGHIGTFVLKKPSATSKFKVEGKKQTLQALALHPDGASIFVGTVAKVLWIDLDTKAVLKSMVGHKGEVSVLELFTVSPEQPPFLISAGNSERDHVISVWKVDAAAKADEDDGLPEAMLNANECVSFACAARDNSEDASEGDALIGCVSASGVFRAFDFDPRSKRKKNKAIRPRATVQVSHKVKQCPARKVEK